jgi:hypothetical protein
VLAICTGQSQFNGTQWTELDTGGWLPGADLQSAGLPDCDGATSTTAPTTLPPITTTLSCPTPDEVLAAWNASPGINAAAQSVTGFQNIQCWSNWVIASPTGNGNGFFTFSQTSGLHGVSAEEAQEFTTDVCSDSSSPTGWRSDPDIASCSQ